MSLIEEKINDDPPLSSVNILEEEKENDNGNIRDAQPITPDVVLRLPTITDSTSTTRI